MPDRVRCVAQYEPDARPRATHICSRYDGHVGNHVCPLCGKEWMDSWPQPARREGT